MPTSPLNVVIQHCLADVGPDGGGMTDRELLARFLGRRDDDALAALVRRHAPMVWGVCCRLLPNRHDAEDAFQATFLVLVRKAASVPRPAVANWLYGVARQTAVRLRATAAKRGRRETQVMNMPEPGTRDQESSDLQSMLDEELGRLPDHYRGVVVLCDLEGLTRKEAARQLGVPEGSVASRLARARALLAKRLTRRGIVFSGGSVAAELSAGPASAFAPPALVASTIRAASLLAAGQAATGAIPATVAALTEGVVKAMFVTKLKSASAVLLVVAALAGAAGLIYQARAAEPPTAKQERHIAQTQPHTEPKPLSAKTDRERMVGNWFIMNDDSGRRGEMWAITEDSILMHAKNGGGITERYAHRLDAGKSPKQIDITVTKVGGQLVGVMKGIYALEGDELRLCLADIGKERPAAFPLKPGWGEVLILQRATSGASPPKAKENPPIMSDQERMVGRWVIVNDDSKAKGQLWVIDKDHILMNYYGPGLLARQYHFLDASKDPKQIDIAFTQVNGPDAIKGIYSLDGNELRLCLGARGKDRPTAFPEKPGPGEVLILHREKPDAVPPKAKEKSPTQSDQERMVGDWVIVRADSKLPGETWTITKDRIHRHSVGTGWQMQWYHRLDAGKDPKQIDIAGQLNGPTVIKGIYVLDGDELRLCLGAAGKDRPAAFPEKPEPGEVLILHRQKPEAEQPKAKEEQPARSDLETMAGLWTIVNGEHKWRDDGLGAKGQFWEIGTYQIVPDPFLTGVRTRQYFHRLDAAKSPKQIDITVTAASNKIGTEFPIDPKNRIIGVVKGIYELDRGEFRLCLGDMGKDRPAAFPEKPKQGEVLILHRFEPQADGGASDGKEKLRVLIDQVLQAHGGEEKLTKLQFSMTVKHSNGYINQYFVQPPRNFRWEQQHRDQTSKMIVILFPEGRRWWTKEPNAEPKGFMPTGIEAPLRFWHDYVKFFGPRQVLRLKDADHKVALLDEQAKIGDRAAVGVQITGPLCTQKMYFDKETHLLLKGVGSDIVREVTFSDYKAFDGIPIAQQEHDGHFEPRVTNFRIVDKFDAKLFEQP
ncbi:MAG: sigma-70 family RNA polymerase sigma factor [Gemmataceae bacterium]